MRSFEPNNDSILPETESGAPTQIVLAFEDNRLASALFRLQKYDESLTQFRKALELDPDYYPALNGVGVCMLNKFLLSDKKDRSAHDEAIQALRRSLQIELKQPAVVDLVTRYG